MRVKSSNTMRFKNTSERSIYFRRSTCITLLLLMEKCVQTNAFQRIQPQKFQGSIQYATSFVNRRAMYLCSSKQDEIDNGTISAETIIVTSTNTNTAAKTGTVNERLIAELQAATVLEKTGSNVSSSGRPDGKSNKWTQAASFFKSTKTDAERRAAIAEAQNLNGVNPVTTLFGALFALVCSVALWWLTQSLAIYFAVHPADSDIYFVERVTLLSRNIIMGLSALASGFFGVTGLGILLLAIRVAYGVVTGELDPTPIVTNSSKTISDDTTKVDMSNVWDMMMNKSTKKRQR